MMCVMGRPAAAVAADDDDCVGTGRGRCVGQGREVGVDLGQRAGHARGHVREQVEPRLADVNWKHGTLITPATPDEPEGEGIAELLDEAEDIINAAGPQILADVQSEQLADSISKSGGVGLAADITRSLLDLQEAVQPPPSTTNPQGAASP